MAFNFPDSPTAGQIFTDATSGAQYVYTNGVWMQSSAAQLKLTAQARNRLVNPAMQISQEWGNTLIGVGYPADQWQHTFATTGAVNAQRVQVITPNKSANRLRFIVTTADTSLTTSELWIALQGIEGIRIADFAWGTASARQVILRFGFKGPAGTYSVSIRNFPVTRSYIANFTISAGQANTDTEQVIIIPGDTAGTWAVDTSQGMQLGVAFAAAANLTGVAGWQGGSFIAAAGASNGLATLGNTFELFDVGLYLDDQATGAAPPWVMPDEAEELRACQRYWQKIYCMVNVNTSNYSISTIPFRSAPAITGGAAGFTVRVNDPNTFIVDQTTRGYQTLILTARM